MTISCSLYTKGAHGSLITRCLRRRISHYAPSLYNCYHSHIPFTSAARSQCTVLAMSLPASSYNWNLLLLPLSLSLSFILRVRHTALGQAPSSRRENKRPQKSASFHHYEQSLFTDVFSHDTCQELKCRWWQRCGILWSRINKNWLQAHVLWNATGTEQLLASLFMYKRTIDFYRWWHFPSRPLATLSNDRRRQKS